MHLYYNYNFIFFTLIKMNLNLNINQAKLDRQKLSEIRKIIKEQKEKIQKIQKQRIKQEILKEQQNINQNINQNIKYLSFGGKLQLYSLIEESPQMKIIREQVQKYRKELEKLEKQKELKEQQELEKQLSNYPISKQELPPIPEDKVQEFGKKRKRRKKIPGFRVFFTLNNGGDAYGVYTKGKKVMIYKGNRKVKELTCRKIIYPKSPSTSKKSSVLLQLANGKYMFVGHKIYTFKPKSPITKYFSYIGPSEVPYPVALTKNHAYFMLDRRAVPKKEFSGDSDVFWNKKAYVVFYDKHRK